MVDTSYGCQVFLVAGGWHYMWHSSTVALWHCGWHCLPNKWSLFWHHKASSPCWCSSHQRRQKIIETRLPFFLSEKCLPLKRESIWLWASISQEISCFEQFYWGSWPLGGVSTSRLVHFYQKEPWSYQLTIFQNPFGVALPKLFPVLPRCAIKLLIRLRFPHFPLCSTLNLTIFQLSTI